MKILMLSTTYPRYKGDLYANFVESLCDELGKKHSIQVVASSGEKAKDFEIRNNVKINRFTYFFPKNLQKLTYQGGITEVVKGNLLAKIQIPFFILSFFLKSLKFAKKSDIIHAQWALSGLIGVILKKLYNKNLVLTIHGAVFYTKKFSSLVKFVLKNTDHVIFNSNYTKEKAFEIIKVKSYSIIPTSVDINKFSYIKNSDLHKKLKLSKDTKIILSVGRLVERKGFEYLIEAMSLLKNKNVHLVIVGKGPLKNKLVNLANELDNITFIDEISDKELLRYYSESYLLVNSSIIDKKGDTEGLGMTTIESMACKTPVIGSRVGGIKEVIRDGVNGYLVKEKSPEEISNKISKLISNNSLRNKLGLNGRKTVENNYTWQENSKETLKVYSKLLNKI